LRLKKLAAFVQKGIAPLQFPSKESRRPLISPLRHGRRTERFPDDWKGFL